MKKFVTAVKEVVFDDEREAKIAALLKTSRTEREAKIAALVKGTEDKPGIPAADAEALVDPAKTREEAVEETEPYAEFELDGRTMRAYQPTDGQLVFMLASLGRGQSSESRFASIINIMMESLRGPDQDYLEGRLLTRNSNRLPVEQIESIFEYLTEEWFGDPSQSQSDSAES